MAGDETQNYMDDPSNLGIYDVNTIANYCPDTISLLEAQPYSAFKRDAVTGRLVVVMYEAPLD